MLFTDTKKILRFIKWPKGTPTGDSIREWLASFDQKLEAPADADPTAKTKMVT